MNQQISVIAFDADDTLWVNEPYFQETEAKFCSLLEDYMPKHSASQELFKTEMANLGLYGYGIKAYILSMLETVLRITGNTVNAEVLLKVIQYGQEMMNKPIELLDGVEEVLQTLSGRYRLVVATKGDLLDQERKLRNSGLEKYFHHIEIMSDKKEKDYLKLLKNLGCTPDEFLMLGNSLKSDVIPVLGIGAHAIHIPYHTTWEHERIDYNVEDPKFFKVETIREILSHFSHETTVRSANLGKETTF